MIYAVDFDGTLCQDEYPYIGAPNTELINYLRNKQALGSYIILNTCRHGNQLADAIEWCSKQHLVFDAVNENLKHLIDLYGDCRKIAADVYIDDKSCHMFKLPYINE